jgi:hypothetical protein
MLDQGLRMDDMPTRARPAPRTALAAVLCLLLAACGGGGGGGGEPPAAAPPAPPPPTGGAGRLAFTVANAGRVAGYPLWAGEHALRLGEALGREVEELRAQPVAESSGDCGTVGRFRRSWDDRDGSGSLSAGDTVRVSYDRCSRFEVLFRAQGTALITVRSLAPLGAAVLDLGFDGAGMATEADVVDPRQVGLQLTGQTRLELLRTPMLYGLVLGGGDGDELVFDIPGLPVPPDRMTAFRLEKNQRWDEARTVLALRMLYSSPELGGSFDVATPAPLRAWLDELPAPFTGQGSVEMRGAGGDVVRLFVEGPGWPAGELGLELDQSGDGRIEGRGSGRWSDIGLVAGFFFRDVSTATNPPAITQGLGGFAMRRPVAVRPQPVDSHWRIQFTRMPLGAEGWRWRLLDLGRLPFQDGGEGEIPIAVEAQGAPFIVRPLAPLRYSRRYELRLDTGESEAQGAVVRDVTGDRLVLFGSQVFEASTPDILNPRILFTTAPALLFVGGEAGLVRWGTGETDLPGTTLRWSQLSGPPLSFSDRDGSPTTVRLVEAVRGVASATVTLTLSLPDGTRETGTQVLRIVGEPDGPWTSRVRLRSPGAFGGPPARDLWGGPAVGTLEARVTDSGLQLRYVDLAGPAGPFTGWSLRLADSQGRPPLPGRTTGAWAAGSAGAPAGAPTLDFSTEADAFIPWDSEWDLHEIETDAEGRVTRLALDFTVRGVGDYVAIPGWVRLNSTRPPPP